MWQFSLWRSGLSIKSAQMSKITNDDLTFGASVALLVVRRTKNRKVVSSRPAKVVCITVLTGNCMGWTARCGRPPLLLPSCRKLEFRLSALMDSDLAWVNGKSGRQSWRYADAFKHSIILGAIYHFNPVWHRMLYSCTHMTTVGVKGLGKFRWFKDLVSL